MVAVSLRTISSNGLDETTLVRRTGTSIIAISLPHSYRLSNGDKKILRAVLSSGLGLHNAFVNVRGGGAVDQQTQ